MGGPAASVLLRSRITEAWEAGLRERISGAADEVKGDDFWMDLRPFILIVGPECPEFLSELAAQGLSDVLGWEPQDVVTFAAMCNSDEDHGLLAKLCIELAEKEAGVIDFGGSLPIGPNLGGAERSQPLRVENPSGAEGVLFATSYETWANNFATAHYGDPALLRSWLRDEHFRMVK